MGHLVFKQQMSCFPLRILRFEYINKHTTQSSFSPNMCCVSRYLFNSNSHFNSHFLKLGKISRQLEASGYDLKTLWWPFSKAVTWSSPPSRSSWPLHSIQRSCPSQFTQLFLWGRSCCLLLPWIRGGAPLFRATISTSIWEHVQLPMFVVILVLYSSTLHMNWNNAN